MSSSLECCIERLTERGLGKWLEQTLHRALFEKGLTDTIIGGRRNENDGHCTPPSLQFLLQIRARHSWHPDVQDQATALGDGIGREELRRRREHAGRKTELLQQIRQ